LFDEVYLTEKDSQVEALAPLLGCKYEKKWHPAYSPDKKIAVVPLQGHLIELLSNPADYDEAYKQWNENTVFCFPDKFKVKPKARTKDLLNRAVKHLKDAKKIIIATDFDNEGAALAMRVIEYAGVEDKVSHMLEMGSVDEKALKKAIENPINIPYREMADAGYARAYLDWADGMTLSRSLTIYIGRGKKLMIFGGVKTPLLYIVVQRDLEFESHKKQKYYQVGGTATAKGKSFNFSVSKKITEEKENPKTKEITKKTKFETKFDKKEEAELIVKKIEEMKNFKISEFLTKDKTENPPQLYDLTSLQADMASTTKASPDDSLSYAQKLYDSYKIQTYPRTAIPYLKEEEYSAVKNILSNLSKIMYEEEINEILSNTIPKRTSVFNSKKVTSHGAIIPTLKDPSEDYQKLPEKTKTMFDLVSKRYIANFMPPYEYTHLKGTVHLFDDYYLTFTENIPKKPGFKKILNKNIEEEITNYKRSLPELSKGDEIEVASTEITEGETKPKPRFTMKTLLEAMKKIANLYPENEEIKKYLGENGLGTPATRAQILKELMTPNKDGVVYLKEEKGKIVSTPHARKLIALTPPQIVSPVKRAKLGEYIQKIEKGELSIDQLLNSWKKQLQQQVLEIKELAKDPKNQYLGEDTEILGPCPMCDGGIIEKKNIYSCSNAKWKKLPDGSFKNEGCGYIIRKNSLEKFGLKKLTPTIIKQLLKNKKAEVTLKSARTGKSYKKEITIDTKWGVKVDFGKNIQK